MHIRTAVFIVVLSVATIFLGRWYFIHKPDQIVIQQKTPEKTSIPLPVPPPAEVVGKLLLAPLDVSTGAASESAMLQFVQKNALAGITVFGESISTQSAARLKDAVAAIDSTLIIATDHEGGTVQRYVGKGFTRLPSWRQQCELSSEERRRLLKQSAQELSSYGVNVVFAPVLDLSEEKSILASRACSSDPLLTAEAARDYVSIFSAEKILPVLKHYPGIGAATVDLHTGLDALFDTPAELPLFKSLAEFEPTPGIMTAHILVQKISEDAPCALSPLCLVSVRENAPKSIVFTDALEMLSARYNIADPQQPLALAQVALKAVYAGNTVLVFGKGVTPSELEVVLQTLKKEYTEQAAFRTKVMESLALLETLQKTLE